MLPGGKERAPRRWLQERNIAHKSYRRDGIPALSPAARFNLCAGAPVSAWLPRDQSLAVSQVIAALVALALTVGEAWLQ